jgi:UPF0755 protein
MNRARTPRRLSAAARGRARRRWLWGIALMLALSALAALAALGWLFMGYPNHRGPGRGRVVAIAIERGAGLRDVAARLAAAGALAEPSIFALHAQLRGAASRLRAGEVLVIDSMSPTQLLQRIARGYGSAGVRVVIPEGFSRFEIAERLARWGVCPKSEFLAATVDADLLRELAIDAPSAEGWLFPDTYSLSDDMDAQALVRRFVHNAARRMAAVEEQEQAGTERLRAELGFGPRELLTLASIVEKEAAVHSEQPIIAGVFLNRLRDPSWKPRRLQADPTVAYGCLVAPELASCAGFDGRQLTRAMLVDAQNPYNTYRIEGLPPGPISNPGASALRAVLAPAEHDYFYFVAKGGGLHEFSHDLQAHNAAVDHLRSSRPEAVRSGLRPRSDPAKYRSIPRVGAAGALAPERF